MAQRVNHGFHVAASLAMLAMVWPGFPRIPVTLQVVFFAVGVGWFAVSAVRSRCGFVKRINTTYLRQSHVSFYHSLMMMAMLWMVFVMTGGASGSLIKHDHSTEFTHPMAPPAARIPGHAQHREGIVLPSVSASADWDWISAVTLAIALTFAAASVIWFYGPAHAAGDLRPPLTSAAIPITTVKLHDSSKLTSMAASEAGMAAGMAIMTLLLI
ncbi:DUF5134 domain-containing protein [Rhodococcus erythropolis]|uniref:DUF5134 domain-containing protein n=1 Tax=Rhodococcus erythropolis TaxID=1833 RepID=UPI003B8A9243